MMVKRKQDDGDGEQDVEHSASRAIIVHDSNTELILGLNRDVWQQSSTKGKAPSKPKTAKKPKFDDSGAESPPREEPAVTVLRTAGGEKYVELGNRKHATVRSFKGKVFVDIREFYVADNDEKPGKKGISLSGEQWEALKRSTSTIDSLFAEHGVLKK